MSALIQCRLPLVSSLRCFGDLRGGEQLSAPRRYDAGPDPRRSVRGIREMRYAAFLPLTWSETPFSRETRLEIECCVSPLNRTPTGVWANFVPWITNLDWQLRPFPIVPRDHAETAPSMIRFIDREEISAARCCWHWHRYGTNEDTTMYVN